MKKNEETEQKIIEAAYALIKAEGFEATSIKQICEKAKIAYSTFYYYFPTKEYIIPKFYSRKKLFTEESFSQILAVKGAWPRLWAAHQIYINNIYNMGPEICAQLNRSLLVHPEADEGLEVMNHGHVLEPLIKQAQEEGDILHTADSKEIYQCSLYLVRGIYFTWSMRRDQFDLHKEMRRSLEVFYQLRSDLREF
ncbi:MAG TPA: TetR/AcrR family transcriptional regulator [Feifaniaceae bacterium]|nr:TetR/AcrR family transcriptional regulator [Feifaniaceae bacterium]